MTLERLSSAEVEPSRRPAFASLVRVRIAREDAAREPGWRAAVGDVRIDLVALPGHRVPAAPRSRRALAGRRWRRTLRDVVHPRHHHQHHVVDPDLGAVMIAPRLRVTPRQVQRVFAGTGTTAPAYIVRRRLERAAQFLTAGHRAVSDIAPRTGFTDLSYFYRGFRKRYGTPREAVMTVSPLHDPVPLSSQRPGCRRLSSAIADRCRVGVSVAECLIGNLYHDHTVMRLELSYKGEHRGAIQPEHGSCQRQDGGASATVPWLAARTGRTRSPV